MSGPSILAGIDRLTAVGNALGLEGRFGYKWGTLQLHARLEALESLVMVGQQPVTPLDWAALTHGLTPTEEP